MNANKVRQLKNKVELLEHEAAWYGAFYADAFVTFNRLHHILTNGDMTYRDKVAKAVSVLTGYKKKDFESFTTYRRERQVIKREQVRKYRQFKAKQNKESK